MADLLLSYRLLLYAPPKVILVLVLFVIFGVSFLVHYCISRPS